MYNCSFCEKECKNKNSLRNHQRLCDENPNRDIPSYKASIEAMAKKIECEFCGEGKSLGNIKKHRQTCKYNPNNIKVCPVCGTNFFRKYATTCSHSCSNTYFNKSRNKDENLRYVALCFRYHKKRMYSVWRK